MYVIPAVVDGVRQICRVFATDPLPNPSPVSDPVDGNPITLYVQVTHSSFRYMGKVLTK